MHESSRSSKLAASASLRCTPAGVRSRAPTRGPTFLRRRTSIFKRKVCGSTELRFYDLLQGDTMLGSFPTSLEITLLTRGADWSSVWAVILNGYRLRAAFPRKPHLNDSKTNKVGLHRHTLPVFSNQAFGTTLIEILVQLICLRARLIRHPACTS